MVKQEMARVNTDILGINKLKLTINAASVGAVLIISWKGNSKKKTDNVGL